MRDAKTRWGTTITCDGGPLLVVDLPGFAQWTGDEPFTELGFEDRRNVLHFWGNLGGAGEQFVELADESKASAELERLCAKVKAHVPDAVVTDEDGVMVIVDPKSGGHLRAELQPRSEYDASWQSNPDVDAWEHAFGKGARALFWDPRGKCGVDVGVAEGTDEIVLVRFLPSGALSKKAEAKEKEAAFALASDFGTREKRVGEVAIASGRVVIAWAPIAGVAVAIGEGDETLTSDVYGPKYGVSAVPARVGAILRVKRGRWVATIGEGNAPKKARAKAGWSARWCRLQRRR